MNVTQDLSILHLILQASAVVQVVMALLAGVSFMSWYYIFMKWFAVKQARAKTEGFERDFWSGGDLNNLYNPALGNSYVIITGFNNTVTSGFNSTVTVNNGASFVSAGKSFQIDYNTGNIALTVIPEPATFGLLLAFGAAAVIRRRRIG